MVEKVSIIMGIYNCQDTLKEAIESIENQTFKDWRLIMCDDASIDNTYEIAEEYTKLYPERFVLLRNESNMGLNYTLNKCLACAKGEYIARMDGDDISLSERLQVEFEFLEKNKEYAIVSSPMKYFDGDGVFRIGKGKGEPNIETFAKGTPFCHAPCMVRREAYEAVNGYSECRKRLRVEDWDLWIRMYEKGYRGYELEQPLYMMRDDKNAYKRRKFKYRINEARVSGMAVRKLNLPMTYFIFLIRPIIVGVLPQFVYKYLHKNK